MYSVLIAAVRTCDGNSSHVTILHASTSSYIWQLTRIKCNLLCALWQERPIRCRNCQSFYLEQQNHDLCCPYHPGEYRRACPRSCPGLTEKCMSHRQAPTLLPYSQPPCATSTPSAPRTTCLHETCLTVHLRVVPGFLCD